MAFQLPELKYDYDALEPHIDAQTMRLHHTQHHQSYVDKLNSTLENSEALSQKTLTELLGIHTSLPQEMKESIRNFGGGHANHSFFWELLSPDKTSPTPQLEQTIAQTFGSFDQFKQKFLDLSAGLFGSGWAWLVKDEQQQLKLIQTANQDSPLMQHLTPVLGVDVWEHAYYLKYQNRRAEYLENFFSLINWAQVQHNLNSK